MRIFRALVLVSLSTYVICYFETTWADPFLSRESQTLLGWDGYNQAWEIPRSVFRLQAALFVVSMVGLFWFLRSARMLYAWLLVAFAIESLIRGMGVSTPLGGLLAYVGVMADGAILSMAFLHPLKTRFV